MSIEIAVFGQVEKDVIEHLEIPTDVELRAAYIDLTTKGDLSNDNVFKAICFITKPCTK